jgi:hypothetical protein
MSVILQPQSSFPIVRQISNHLDATVYYVRAVVRNADGDTIDTVNLTSQGSQRYQSRYRVPVDSSGQGAYISIVTSVYTDSGYTTKSDNYGDEENTYLVFDRVSGSRGGGSGGGNIDIGTIRRVVAEELEKALPEEVEDEPEEVEIEKPDTTTPKLDQLTKDIASLQTAIAKIPTDTLDLSDIKQAMETIYGAVEDKEVTPPTDLTPTLEAIDSLAIDVLQQVEGLRQFVAGTETELKKTIVETISDNMQNTEFVTDFQVRPKRKLPSNPQTEQPAYDINKLSM